MCGLSKRNKSEWLCNFRTFKCKTHMGLPAHTDLWVSMGGKDSAEIESIQPSSVPNYTTSMWPDSPFKPL